MAHNEFGVDTSEMAKEQSGRPIVELFSSEIEGFSKYRLAKSYIRWTRENRASDLLQGEQEQWKKLIESINKVLK